MTKTETNKALALAIGYLPEHVRIIDGDVEVYRPRCQGDLNQYYPGLWWKFDCLYPSVILPIAKHYGLSMDYFSTVKLWQVTDKASKFWKNAESLEDAIALCVIELNKGKL